MAKIQLRRVGTVACWRISQRHHDGPVRAPVRGACDR